MDVPEVRFAAARPLRGPSFVVRALGTSALLAHGAIHATGVALLWELGEPGALSYADASPDPGSGGAIVAGGLWLLAGMLFVAAGVLFALSPREGLSLATVASIISLPVVLPMAAHAPFGVAVDVAILLCCGILLLRSRQSSAGAARRGPPLPVPAAVAHDWAELATPRAVRVDVFEPGRLGTFPAPVRRWLEHAIAPGTPLVPRVELTTHGEIKIGPWMYYDARQILAPPAGMVWTAVTGLGPLNIRGFDRYTRHQGELNWRIFGAIPFLRARGEKVDRSAAGRLAAEALLNPASALAPWVSWQAIDDAHATARMTIDGAVHSVTIEVDPGGRLLGCTLPRSGGPGKDPDRVSAFHVAFDGEVAFNEFTIPATLTAGWDWSGSRWANGSFFRATITQARFY